MDGSKMSYYEEEKKLKADKRSVDVDFIPSVPVSIAINGFARELSGFTSGADYDRAISYSLKRQKDYDILLQNQYDEITKVRKELSEIDPKYDLLDLIPKKQKELDELMNEGLVWKAEKQDEERYCEAVREARKKYMFNLRNDKIEEALIQKKFHNGDTIYDRLENAESELKQLEVKVYKGVADKLEQERYNELKEFVIPDLEKQVQEKGIVDWSKAKLKDDNAVSDENIEENVEENVDDLEKSDSSNDDLSSENDEEKDKDKEQGEDVVKKANLDPEKPKKVKFLSKAKEKLVNIIDGKAAKAVMAAAGFVAAIALIVTNPALLALVPAAKIAYDYNKGRKL